MRRFQHGLQVRSGLCAGRVIGHAAFLILVAGAAQGQDQLANVGSNTNESESFNPGDIPGREQGKRRADAATPEPAPPAEAAASEWFGGASFWEWSRMTGDWDGGRTVLENKGLSFDASYTLDWSSVWEGGLRNVASTRSVLSLSATLDFGKMFELQGASFFVNYLSSDNALVGGVRFQISF